MIGVGGQGPEHARIGDGKIGTGQDVIDSHASPRPKRCGVHGSAIARLLGLGIVDQGVIDQTANGLLLRIPLIGVRVQVPENHKERFFARCFLFQ